MFQKLTDRVNRAIASARETARQSGHAAAGPSHLLHGIIQVGGVSTALLQNLNVDPRHLQAELERAWDQRPPAAQTNGRDPLEHILQLAHEESQRLGADYIGTEHLLLAVIREPDSAAETVLRAASLALSAARQQAIELFGGAGGQPGSPPDAGVARRLNRVAEIMRSLARELEELAEELEKPGGPVDGG